MAWRRLFIALAVAAAPLPGAWEARSEHFHVVSEAGPSNASLAAAFLEELRERYAGLGFAPRAAHQRTAVLILDGLDAYRPYGEAGNAWSPRNRGLSFVAAGRNQIVLGWNAPDNPWIGLAHEYAHLTDPETRAPLWHREGRAEYLSRLAPGADGALVQAGPPGFIAQLAEESWMPLDALLAAQEHSLEPAHPLFYAQSWLLYGWLVEQLGEPRLAHSQRALELIENRGLAAVELQLRARAAQWLVRDLPRYPAPEAAPGQPSERPLETWETAFWRAEPFRLLERWPLARAAFAPLEPFAGEPAVAAALGAMAMAEGRYDEAEQLLATAAGAPGAEPETRHRYALLLLRPAGAEGDERPAEAVRHAQAALAERPGEARYRLTLAHALMVAGSWDAAARELTALARLPAWSGRAGDEFRELLRRRQQAMREVPAPRLEVREPHPAVFAALSGPGLPILPREPAWPPWGTSIIAGRIAGVECANGQKFIVLESRLFDIRFREQPERPARLLSPPKKWKSIPCGTYGWNVHIAYKPTPKSEGARGEVVAILF